MSIQIQQITEYIVVDETHVSHCQRKTLQMREGENLKGAARCLIGIRERSTNFVHRQVDPDAGTDVGTPVVWRAHSHLLRAQKQ